MGGVNGMSADCGSITDDAVEWQVREDPQRGSDLNASLVPYVSLR